MAEKPEDFNLPAAAVARLVKDALPPGVKVSNDARTALGKATSIFILYATSSAQQQIETENGELNAQAVIDACAQPPISFEMPLLEQLKTTYDENMRIRKAKAQAAYEKRQSKLHEKANASAAGPTSGGGDGEQDEDQEGDEEEMEDEDVE